MGPGIYHDAHAITAEDGAYRHIHAAIRMGRYRAGERLVPEAIASEIGTSRMPVREAFRRLATEGLVTIRPNRGVTVSGLNLSDMQEIFEMRAVLEGLAVRLALPHMTAASIRQLEDMLARLDDRDGIQPDWTTAHRTLPRNPLRNERAAAAGSDERVRGLPCALRCGGYAGLQVFLARRHRADGRAVRAGR